MKLYRVNLVGTIGYKESYVIANDTNEAYQKVKNTLDSNNLGFVRDRELKSVEVIAAEDSLSDIKLFL
jgi:hypothetical protein